MDEKHSDFLNDQLINTLYTFFILLNPFYKQWKPGSSSECITPIGIKGTSKGLQSLNLFHANSEVLDRNHLRLFGWGFQSYFEEVIS